MEMMFKVIIKTRIHMLPSESHYMDLVCNIDAKGKAIRLLTGIFAILAGLTLAILVNLGTISLESYWLLVSGSIIGGIFAMWEARAGWCVVRAIGIKTPI